MKKNRINTTSIREIKHSFKRFLSLLIMSMLGVGVFVGISAAAPDMMKSIDTYYDNSNYYDIKIVSTLGLTEDDIDKLSNVSGIKKAYGSYSKDVIMENKENESVIKVIGITDDVNKIEVEKGRKPKNNDEIIVEKSLLEHENLKIGDKIKLQDEESFNKTELTIVGVVRSPLYISNFTASSNRGNTNLGSGKINYYTYVNNSNFKLDYYTESYVIVNDAKNKLTNSKQYNELVDKTLSKINKIKTDREKNRHDEIYNKINDEIIKNENEGLNRLNAAKNELDIVNVKLKNGKVALDGAKNELADAYAILDTNKSQLDAGKLELDKAKSKLEFAKQELDAGKSRINEELEDYEITLDDINNFKENISKIDISKETIINSIPSDTPYYEEIIDIINNIDVDNLKDSIKDLVTNSSNIDKIIDNIPNETPNYDEIIEVLETYKQNSDKIIELIEAIERIEKAEEEYNDGLALYNLSLAEYNKNYDVYVNYYNEYQNGLSVYNNSLREYNNSLNLYNTGIEEYYNSKNMFDLKMLEAKKALNDIPEAKWYIYKRLDDSQYSGFIDDGNSVSNLSKVFPTIFFVVAILISLISMSRMVEDDRIEIGTIKSLGFSNKHIRKKYLLYSGIATITGGLIGSLLGFFLLPKYIWNIYKILFMVPVFKYYYDPTNVIIGITIATICICGTTLFTIKKVVKEKPSELMRPKAPENGKRVILEKIPFVWNRINFSNKITVRNLFRYKKRVLMTVGGILGCTALMLAGFGIRDSIVDIPEKQYKEVFNFDEMVYLTDNVSQDEIDKIFNSDHIVNRLDTKMLVSATTGDYNINIFVPNDDNNIKNVLDLRSLNTGKKLDLEDNKIVISDKLSELTNKKTGDKLTITDSENKTYEFIISGVCENYVGHYVFINKDTYEENFGEYNTNIVYINIDNLKNEEKISTALLENDNVMSVMSVNSTINSVDDMLKTLNSVVLILIILSGALSFVVLYNLSYINISERKREIATLKVLGFTDKEVDKYITKETIILTLIGIVLGLIFGIFLTNVIIDTVEIEMVRFLHNINISSFIITAIFIILFTLIVNRIIHFALKKIDMIESLKSVE